MRVELAVELVSIRMAVVKPSTMKLPASERVIVSLADPATVVNAIVAAMVCAVEPAVVDCRRICEPWDSMAITASSRSEGRSALASPIP